MADFIGDPPVGDVDTRVALTPTSPRPERHPAVAGNCPACGDSLFLGNGGGVTCMSVDCPDPARAAKLLRSGPDVWKVIEEAKRLFDMASDERFSREYLGSLIDSQFRGPLQPLRDKGLLP